MRNRDTMRTATCRRAARRNLAWSGQGERLRVTRGRTGNRRSALARALCFLSLGACLLGSAIGCKGQGPLYSVEAGVVYFDVGEKRCRAEVAHTFAQRKRGLMHRESLGENQGMLFVYREPQLMGFWMENTLIPLSIAYIDDSGKILQIEDMQPLDRSSIRSKHEVRFALEMNQGWFARSGLGVGDVLEGFPERVKPFLDRAE